MNNCIYVWIIYMWCNVYFSAVCRCRTVKRFCHQCEHLAPAEMCQHLATAGMCRHLAPVGMCQHLAPAGMCRHLAPAGRRQLLYTALTKVLIFTCTMSQYALFSVNLFTCLICCWFYLVLPFCGICFPLLCVVFDNVFVLKVRNLYI